MTKMNRPSRRLGLLSLGALVGIGLAAAGCGSDPEEAAPKIGPKIGSASAALTAEDCTVGTVDGKDTICHRTLSTTNPYTLITISTQSCDAAHIAHVGDFVATPRTDCSCVPDGNDCAGVTAVGCCGGDTCQTTSSGSKCAPPCPFSAEQVVAAVNALVPPLYSHGCYQQNWVSSDGKISAPFQSLGASSSTDSVEVATYAHTNVDDPTTDTYNVYVQGVPWTGDNSVTQSVYLGCTQQINSACSELGWPVQGN